MSTWIDVKISADYIELGAFLKFVKIISNGGMAKYFLVSEKIYVNSLLENRRGKKLRSGDEIFVLGRNYKIA